MSGLMTNNCTDHMLGKTASGASISVKRALLQLESLGVFEESEISVHLSV